MSTSKFSRRRSNQDPISYPTICANASTISTTLPTTSTAIPIFDSEYFIISTAVPTVDTGYSTISTATP